MSVLLLFVLDGCRNSSLGNLPSDGADIWKVRSKHFTSRSVNGTDAKPPSLAPEITERTRKMENKLIALKPSRRKTVRKTDVILEGNWTIDSVEQVQKELAQVFIDYDIVTISLKSTEDMDLSFVQLLYYTRELYTSQGKTVNIKSELSEDFAAVVSNSGLAPLMLG